MDDRLAPTPAPRALDENLWRTAKLQQQLERQRREDEAKHRAPEFLRPGQFVQRKEQQTLQEELAFIERFWRGVQQQEASGLEETKRTRLEIAWRVVRSLALLQRLVS